MFLLRLVLVLVLAVGTLNWILYRVRLLANEPGVLNADDVQLLMASFPPTTISQLTSIESVLLQMSAARPTTVTLLFSAIYLWKYSFAFPGSLVLNVLAGVLFRESPVVAILIATGLGAVGSTICYAISKFVGPDLVLYLAGSKLQALRVKMEAQRSLIFNYMLFARMFPFSPHWFINLASPWVGVPIKEYFLATLLGMIPYHMITIQSGVVLSTIKSTSDVFSSRTIISLIIMALAVLSPVYLKKAAPIPS